MDFSCSVTPKPNTHLAKPSLVGLTLRIESNGIFGERLGGSLKKSFFGVNETTMYGSENRIEKNVKPGIAFSVATSKDTREVPPMQVPRFHRPKADPKTVAVMILGAVTKPKLFPLTRIDATPALSIGGSHRLIDIPMSNCINSGLRKIYVLTQFNSDSLNRHIFRTYHGNGVSLPDDFVELLAATQTPGEGGKEWFRGSADAVRKFAWVLHEDLRSRDIENVVILSGDHLYSMDYMHFVQSHVDRNADITISCVALDDSRASDYGLVKIDSREKIIKFVEKPKGADLESMKTDMTLVGLSKEKAMKCPYIASMGVYVFKKDILLEVLQRRYPKLHDFGSEIFPVAVEEYNVQAYIFRDYWEEISNVKTFYEANLALGEEDRKFEFYDPGTPFFTTLRFLPPSKIEKCRIVDSIISLGCVLKKCSVQHSVVGACSRLDNGVELKDTVMMGADCYQNESEIKILIDEGEVPLGIGENSKIRKCIIEMNAKIGKNVVIRNKDGVEEAERPGDGFYIRSGITIVLEKATIKDGTIL